MSNAKNSMILLILLVFVLAIAIFTQRNFLNINKKTENVSDKKVENSTPTVTSTLTPTATPTVPKNSPSLIILSPTNPPQNPQNQESFIYPNSTKISVDEKLTLLKSSDNSQAITDWYIEKIKNAGMNTKSFVQTKTNDNILNKLVGSDGKKEIRVEIARLNNQSETMISVIIMNL